MLIYTILPWYIEFIEWLIPHAADFVDSSGMFSYIAAHIAASHSIFNVCATWHLFLSLTRIVKNHT